MSIGDVKGSTARPSWKFFYEQTKVAEPTWNFKGKFLVSKTGAVTAVDSGNLESEINKLTEGE